jgi:hypothetical protein
MIILIFLLLLKKKCASSCSFQRIIQYEKLLMFSLHTSILIQLFVKFLYTSGKYCLWSTSWTGGMHCVSKQKTLYVHQFDKPLLVFLFISVSLL